MGTARDLFDSLDVKHPDYLDIQPDWEIYRDVLGDVQVNKEKYLPRGKSEIDSLYALRVSLSQFLPESAMALQKILAGLYREKPRRDFKDAKLAKWIDNVDAQGSHWNQYVERIAEKLLGYGTLRLLVNIQTPQLPDGQEMSRADELAQSSQPFLVLYNPLSVIDWEVGDRGQLLMVRIKETRVQKAPPPDHHAAVTRFIRYTREEVSWWEFTQSSRGFELQAAVEGMAHGLGIVPMVVDYFPKQVKPMIGSSYIRYSSRADIQKYQAESDLQYNAHVHAHPTFWAKVADELSQIGIGSNAFIKLNPDGNEEVGYVEAPLSSFEALKGLIDEKRAVVFRHAGTDPLGVLQATGSAAFQASGVSRAWSFGTSESRILGSVADRMESVERQVFEIVSRYTSGRILGSDEQSFKGEINYPEEFDLSATQTLIDETEQIGQMINSETLIRILHQRIASSKIGDATAKVLKEVHKEIEENDLIGTPVGKKPIDPASMPPNPAQIAAESEPEPEEEEPTPPPREGATRGRQPAPTVPPRRSRTQAR